MLLSSSRIFAAAAVMLFYGLGCLLLWHRHRQTTKEQVVAADSCRGKVADIRLFHASQTGYSRQLAAEAQATLGLAGITTQCQPLGSLTWQELQEMADQKTPVLFIVSTCGEGDAPDEAAAFAAHCLQRTESNGLLQLHYGLLALGDNSYRYFCGFGRALDEWLQRQGATPLFPSIEVDRGDQTALAEWQHRINLLSGNGNGEMPDTPLPTRSLLHWRLVQHQWINRVPETAVVQIDLEPVEGPLPQWQGGDLALIEPPPNAEDDHQPRAYSIATLPDEGKLRLLVRVRQDANGNVGKVSGWLSHLTAGSLVPITLRSHPNFHLSHPPDYPLVLIGTGTGIAGLRPLLRQRMQSGQKENWLVFGGRHRQHDFYFSAEIEQWRKEGWLARLDLAFSRDQNDKIYVQHLLQTAAEDLRHWLDRGAALYVCGSASTLGPAIDTLLIDLVGQQGRLDLLQNGRYRRDVY